MAVVTIKSTQNAASPIYRDALAIRQTVFIEEQGVPSEIEIDDQESDCLHFVLYLDNQAVATCRLLQIDAHQVKLQRMAVLPTARGKKLGKRLLEHVLQFARSEAYHLIILGAQNSAIPFYQAAGFKIDGKEFQEAGIAHHMMTKPLQS